MATSELDKDFGYLLPSLDNIAKGENYFKAEIVAGKVGRKQSTKRVEFD